MGKDIHREGLSGIGRREEVVMELFKNGGSLTVGEVSIQFFPPKRDGCVYRIRLDQGADELGGSSGLTPGVALRGLESRYQPIVEGAITELLNPSASKV